MSSEIHVRDLKAGTEFRIGSESYRLIDKNDLRAHVRSLRKTRVRVQGREFDRNGRMFDISPESVVEEVLG